MMRKLILPLILLALLFPSCSTTENSTADDSSRMIITLAENPSTGYSWIWGQMGTGHIEIADDRFIPPESSLAGAPGDRELTFIGTVPGHVTLTLSCIRPWEENSTASGSVIYSVTVYDDMTISYL